jgi:murein DD-endopeptidase MepM/ murein hydrolase activator NlpD
LRQNHSLKPLIALVLCAALLSVGPGSPVTTFASDGYDENVEVSDEANDESYYTGETTATSAALDELYAEQDRLNNRMADLENQQKSLEADIAGARTEKERAIAERDGLAVEISIKTEKIAVLEEQIILLGQKVELQQLYIEEKQAEIDANYRLLEKRLAAMYMQDDGTMLGLLIGSDNFADFLSRSEYTVAVAEHDRNLLQELTDQRIDLEEQKADLEASMEQQEADKATVEEEKAALDVMHAEASRMVQDINAMEQEYLANLTENKALQDAAAAALDDVFQQIEWSKNPYSGGVMTWPLPGHSTITSTYGLRFSGNDLHTGMDISSDGSGCYGDTIVAAADGVVKMVNTTYAEVEGFGIYTIIDHGVDENGRSVSTLYGHCSALYVSLGQEVKKGEAIAAVGSTGWSTGAHLHFEVRLDGQHTEPSQYLMG